MSGLSVWKSAQIVPLLANKRGARPQATLKPLDLLCVVYVKIAFVHTCRLPRKREELGVLTSTGRQIAMHDVVSGPGPPFSS